MNRALLLQLDGGGFPNIALMRLSTHLKQQGCDVQFRRGETPSRFQNDLFEPWDKVYASAIFLKTTPIVEAVRHTYPHAIIGGTGVSLDQNLEQHGVDTLEQDYSIYPSYPHSIGFSQRGCRLKCEFCVVPKKEGRVRTEKTIAKIWRGDPHPRNIVLLDNDFFGQVEWRARIREIIDGNFKVSFNQGINARCLTDEAAEAIASVKYSDDGFTTRRIYTAWDSRGDEERLFKGLDALVRYGVKPDHIMVYMLCGYWPFEAHEDRDYRRMRLRQFGARPYPMPFTRTIELVGFQRWVIGAYDKRIAWSDWKAAEYRPERLRVTQTESTGPGPAEAEEPASARASPAASET